MRPLARYIMTEGDCNAAAIAANLKVILGKIDAAHEKVKDKYPKKPCLVAISKTKPVSDLKAAYDAGQRVFGENYPQELDEKAHNPELLKHCPDLKFHFVGRLQTNKVKKLLTAPQLDVIETITSEKLATEVEKRWEATEKGAAGVPLKVMIQINTSGEEQKNGCDSVEALKLAQFIRKQCPHLSLIGVMTIGRLDHDISKGDNPDFVELRKCHTQLCADLGVSPEEFECSMGMSGDFEHAIHMGSSNVRVGSILFGARNYANKTT